MVGIDIEEISRFERLYLRKPRLLESLFSSYEWEYAIIKPKPYQTLAGFWCAKESVVKAFASIKEVSIRNVNIIHLENGSPQAIILDSKYDSNFEINISISHSKQQATAIAIVARN
jgi:holo-[acyl-carrier protein] synthase